MVFAGREPWKPTENLHSGSGLHAGLTENILQGAGPGTPGKKGLFVVQQC